MQREGHVLGFAGSELDALPCGEALIVFFRCGRQRDVDLGDLGSCAWPVLRTVKWTVRCASSTVRPE